MMKVRRAIIEVSGLNVHREGRFLLKEIQWRVEAGQHWVILGANGSGKTSLLSVLTGYLMPSDGTITVLGECYGQSDWRDLKKKVGLVSAAVTKMVEPEEATLQLVASGREAVVNSWHTTPQDLRRARQILKQIDAENLADRPWRVLSQGERQRALIGRAMMARPSLLILDEPCAGLDPVAREHFLQFIERLARAPKGPSLILVTHHVEEIMPSFSNVLLLREGQLMAQGVKRECLTSKNLSKAFGASLSLRRVKGRYQLKVGRGGSASVF